MIKSHFQPANCPLCCGPLAWWPESEYPERLECLYCGSVSLNLDEWWATWEKQALDRMAHLEVIREAEAKGMTKEGLDRLRRDLGL